MDSGFYAAMTGLIARSQALDTAASNLANAQTPGYRAEHEYFRSVFLDLDGGNSQLGSTLNNFGLLGGDRLSQAQGPLAETGNSLDLAIEGQGYFEIRTAQGIRFTRDGNFHRSQEGYLVTSTDDAVLSPTAQPIALPPGELSVGEDGSISLNGSTTAKVGVVSFPEGTRMIPEGINRYSVGADVVSRTATNMSVHQKMLEGANEDAVQGAVELIVMQREAEMMQKALYLFHTDLNKFAAEELPRV